MSLSASVIVCTRDRAVSLARTLGSIGLLDLDGVGDFELVVVDNGSSDTTRDVVRTFSASAPFRVHYVHEPNAGLSFARNAGIGASRGEIILFTDDDCLPDRDWAACAVKAFRGDARKVLGGRIELHDPSHLNVTTRTGEAAERLQSIAGILGFIHGANMAFGRSAVDAIGPFDVRLGAGTRLRSAEDLDFVYRALVHRIPVAYEPSFAVRHDHGRTGEQAFWRLRRGYYVGVGALSMKHLLFGRKDLVKLLYWDVRAAVRDRRKGLHGGRELEARWALAAGAVRFIVADSWRRPA